MNFTDEECELLRTWCEEYIKGDGLQYYIVKDILDKLTPFPFEKGARVRFKVHKKGQTKKLGIIRGRPRRGSTTTYVVWPDGWAGHVFLDEIEVVR